MEYVVNEQDQPGKKQLSIISESLHKRLMGGMYSHIDLKSPSKRSNNSKGDEAHFGQQNSGIERKDSEELEVDDATRRHGPELPNLIKNLTNIDERDETNS
jgi:hypothetical protein